MKLIFTTTLICMTLAFAFMAETNHVSNQRDESGNLTFMEIIQSILNDPEFLALSSRQQLHVLISIYNVIIRARYYWQANEISLFNNTNFIIGLKLKTSKLLKTIAFFYSLKI